jgi:hypothetical protein
MPIQERENTMKLSRLTACLALIVGVATGCGGAPAGADAPTDADKAEFCKVIQGIDLGGSADDFAADLSDVGTPDGIPAEAREGFEIMIDNASEDTVSDENQEKVSVFLAYFTEVCGAVAAR